MMGYQYLTIQTRFLIFFVTVIGTEVVWRGTTFGSMAK